MHKDRPGRQHDKVLRAKPKRKKNTYRFCRGVVGRSHKVEWKEHPLWDGRIMSWDLACTVCSKVLETVWARDICKPKSGVEIEWEKQEKKYEYLRRIS